MNRRDLLSSALGLLGMAAMSLPASALPFDARAFPTYGLNRLEELWSIHGRFAAMRAAGQWPKCVALRVSMENYLAASRIVLPAVFVSNGVAGKRTVRILLRFQERVFDRRNILEMVWTDGTGRERATEIWSDDAGIA